mmetsp:Transcript_25443/g.73458  ORF Transcript_25443/g.73458 Transcript_25443/m.73458 type:complete len:202 (-) Transcript_25443:806-1411(-)
MRPHSRLEHRDLGNGDEHMLAGLHSERDARRRRSVGRAPIHLRHFCRWGGRRREHLHDRGRWRGARLHTGGGSRCEQRQRVDGVLLGNFRVLNGAPVAQDGAARLGMALALPRRRPHRDCVRVAAPAYARDRGLRSREGGSTEGGGGPDGQGVRQPEHGRRWQPNVDDLQRQRGGGNLELQRWHRQRGRQHSDCAHTECAG